MRVRGSLSALTSAAVFLGVCAGFGAAQEKKAAAPPMDEKAMREMWQKMATPGDGHKKLEALAGSWTAKTTIWMDPSKPPQVTEGTSEAKWVLGGRYLEQRYEGKFMEQPFLGLGYTGFDNFTKKYESTWMDTAGTSVMVLRGAFDKSGKVLTASGKTNDFASGKLVTIREKTTIVSNDEVLFEMWGPAPDGKDFKMMEIRYTRQK